MISPKELKAMTKFWKDKKEDHIILQQEFKSMLASSDNIFLDLNFKVESLTTYCILIIIRIIWDVSKTDKLPEWFLTQDFGEINGQSFNYQTINMFLETNLTTENQGLIWHNDYFSNISPIFYNNSITLYDLCIKIYKLYQIFSI